ncbi:E3 ubiquitin-protein ligase SH3RF1-like isoform X2 [Scylla paramamosain]|uniref:E3 ubiquitin-protein ligase SH3RF1-like isoform X2 n=1 Tax=Scylla paramamosain TaxID=85552 RepID=UPI0030830206
MEQLLLSDALECSVCLEQLGSNSRVLPCQHTFCRRCLDDIVETHKELRCPECRVLVEAAVDELPPNILLMRILESMKSAPRPALSQPIKPSQTVPHPSQPPGRSDPHDGPPLTQAPPPPTIQSFQTSIAYTGTDSTHGFTGGGGGGHSGPFGGSALSGTTLGGYSGSLGREGSIGHGGFNAGVTSLGNLSINLTPSTQSSQHSPLPLTTHRQTSLQPCAKALYNYERKEAGDLSFKKGDVIILRKKIDSNWYEGELNNQVGFFPASYVQVITPLPSHIPQCKALYDFKMTNDEERDCLTFNKGEILTVLRRVDENWAEGKLGSRIGIFPLSFVDLNSAAKALMKLSLNSQQGPSRVAPPTPTRLEGEPATPLILSEGPGSHPPSTQPQQHVPLQIESSSSSSSVVTSPDPSLPSPTTSASPPNIGPSPSSPLVQSSAVAPLLRGPSKRHQREKRHSFTAVRTTQNPSPPRSPASPQRHSVEIISPTEENTSPGSTTAPTNGNGNGLVPQGPSSLEETVAGGEVTTPPESMGSPRLRTSTQSSTPPMSSSTPQVNATTFYVALYSYRGRKADELELKKSHIYTVTEKCQDGWFKGRCITTDRTGVFPGNYVQVAKPQMISAYLAKRNARSSSTNHSEGGSGGGSQSGSSSGSSSVPQTGVVSYTRPRPNLSGGPDGRNSDGSRGENTSLLDTPVHSMVPTLSPTHSSPHAGSLSPGAAGGLMGGSPPCLPPELPPRSVSSGTETSSAHRTSGLTSSSWHPSSQTPQGFSVNQRSVSGISNTVSPPPNIALGENSSVATSSTTPAKVERVRRGLEKSTKDRGSSGGSGMSLMRKLASSGKKKSKSPPPSYSMDNPVFEDSTVSTNVLQHVHTRSGSCPGTLVGGGAGGVLVTGIGFGPNSRLRAAGGSCRVRSRDRPNVFLSNLMLRGRSGSNPDTTGVGVSSSPLSSSPPPGTQGNTDSATDTPRRKKQPAPLVRERFRCIVPYPPNSEYELELQLGDIIYVHKKRDDGWYKGTLQRTGKTGLFPASFVDSC